MSSDSLNKAEEEYGQFDLAVEETVQEDISKRAKAIRDMSADFMRKHSDQYEEYNSDILFNYSNSFNRVSNQNSTMSFFNRKRARASSTDYNKDLKEKWFSKDRIVPITICARLCFYMTSLYNNRTNKFKFIEYMGELTMIYEQSNKLMIEVLKNDRKEKEDEGSTKSKDPLYFLDKSEMDDDISNTFRRIDIFLEKQIQFMTLCSAPVDLFLDKYFTARSNSCGLMEIQGYQNSTINFNCGSYSNPKETFYIHYSECEDEDAKDEFLIETEKSYPKKSDRLYSTSRRIASLHTILGQLNAISEFIKTTVDMNDQLLFRLLMLCGSFFMLVGEYVWNVHMKEYHNYYYADDY